MNQFTLKTIQKGRIDSSTMNKIIGGRPCDIYQCPIHVTSQCVSARGDYESCSLPAMAYQDCTIGVSFTSCESTWSTCHGKN